ncbi:MAG: L-serine/L-threonine ammonia-lyase [Myxococcota bacterium]|jgi:L-serine/L-threonine ammonia-lyase
MHVKTPTIQSTPLTRILGRPVWLKLENTQPTGSFKLRGIGAMCRYLVDRGATRLVASSGGNAGYAAAWAGRQLGVPVTLVVPETTPEFMRARIAAEGAEVIVHGSVWDEAHARALTIGGPEVMVHPFDHPAIWTGHASLVDEAAAELPDPPGAVVVAVGGGGLLCGVLEGMHAVGWESVPVVAVETFGADCLNAALAAGGPVDIGAITSIAKTLGARTVATEAYAWTQKHDVRSVRVQDESAVSACDRFAEDHRFLVEVACGSALSVVYDRAPALVECTGAVLVVVCGGAGVQRL